MRIANEMEEGFQVAIVLLYIYISYIPTYIFKYYIVLLAYYNGDYNF